MVTTTSSDLRLRPDPSTSLPDDGSWRPRSRSLAEALPRLVAEWPDSAGRITRVLYCPLDWDDRPRGVQVGGRVVKTGMFPRDESHQLTLVMSDHRRLLVDVLGEDAPPSVPAD